MSQEGILNDAQIKQAIENYCYSKNEMLQKAEPARHSEMSAETS
jgi:hypothetical protein